jgi:hypothetical protein
MGATVAATDPELLRQFHAACAAAGAEPALVLLRGKLAFQKGWPLLRPSLDEAIEHLRASHENSVGVQPASLGFVALDCDEGDGPRAAVDIVGDAVACSTPSSSGLPNKGHVWIRCDDPHAVGNWKFRLQDPIDGEARGEMRTAGGQVRLNDRSMAILAERLFVDGPSLPPDAFRAMRTATSEASGEYELTEADRDGHEAPWAAQGQPIPERLRALLELDGHDDRSRAFWAACGAMHSMGLSLEAALETLAATPCAERYEREGRLEAQARHAWTTFSAERARRLDEDFPAEARTGPVDAAPDDAEDLSPRAVMSRWVFVADAMKFIRRADLKQFKPEQWNSINADLDPEHNLVMRVYKGKTPVRRYESLAYVPSAPEELPRSTYNIWRPSGVEPREGDVSVMEDHLEYLFPDATERGHVLDFMHFVCVRPDVKVMFAPLIQGAQGTGKTALGVLLKRIIGAANVSEPSPDELKERWTKWQEGASLAIVEELMTNGRLELANKLKPVITNDSLRIEDKGAPLYSIPNHLNLLCFTNHKNAVRLEAGDRRWMVLFSPAEPRDEAYYRRLWRFIEGRDGPAAWLHRLAGHEPRLNPKGRAPMTEAKAEMRIASMTDIEATVAEWMASRTGPMRNDLFRFEDAWGELDWRSRPSKASLGMALKAAGCVQHSRQTNPGLPSIVLWSCCDHERWGSAGAAERTRAWMGMKGLESIDDFNEMV